MLPLPPLSAVRVFEAAARLEHFSAAAKELGMTQAAVSYQIRLLEERLGVSLFQRIGRRVALTDRGRTLAPVIIRAFDDMRAGFAAFLAEESTVLTISCANSFASLWLLPRLGEFQTLYPDLAVRLEATDRNVDFARDGVDVAVRGGEGLWPGLEATLVTRQRIAPCCSPAFLERHGPITSVAQLGTLPLLTPEDPWWSNWFGAMGEALDREKMLGRIAIGSQHVEGRMAIAGQGLAILNVQFWHEEIAAGLLVEAVPSHVIDPWSFWVVHPPHSRNLPKVKAFREWVIERFAKDMGEPAASPPT
ncbi:MAG TPA: LysR substrate-binding domain-containing protein [Sphingobium sp.]|uniref:LysR substrate-binding domain-containing protein n=1 Tax=Sphingobium sp. TaxID=1912891 RepID=UPI002ED48C9F